MNIKRKIKLLFTLMAFSSAGYAQGVTPDFDFALGKTNYFMMLSKGNAKSKNDSVFYNLYRYGKTQRIGKELKHIVNRNTGDTIKSGSYEVIKNQIFFYQEAKNKATILRLYTQNSKGLLSVQTGVSNFVALPKPASIAPLPPYDNSGHPEKVDIPAEFPGGINKARLFLANNITYPDEAVENGVNGTVQVKFTVEVDGSISNIVILNKLGYGCDEEVIRVLKRMPKWTPAKVNGKFVRSNFRMPVSFRTE